jgi:hypothetical protein
MANEPGSGSAVATREKTLAGKVAALIGVIVSCLFLANLTGGGIVPLEIPDVFPIIGNLDEVFFSGVLIASLNYLGIPLIPNFRGEAPPRRIDEK